MPCYFPIKAWRGLPNENGKRPIVFSPSASLTGVGLKGMEIPCGQCIGCRLDYAREWAVRLMHERQLHEEACYVTLTYNDENLPKDGSLNVEDIQKFFKRLRRRYEEKNIRFFQCGEYGENFSRPHHHAIIFGHDFRLDGVSEVCRKSDSGFDLMVSGTLMELWPYGFSSVGDVSFNSCCYVARYVTKKVTGRPSVKHYNGRRPEFVTMSRRPGIGSEFYEKFGREIYNTDSVIVNGHEQKPPRYYDKKLAIDNPVEFDKIRENRLADRDPFDPEVGFDRMAVKEKVRRAKLEFFSKRSFENA